MLSHEEGKWFEDEDGEKVTARLERGGRERAILESGGERERKLMLNE